MRDDIAEIRSVVNRLEKIASENRGRIELQNAIYNKRDKTYIRLFAAVGSIGAFISMCVLIVQAVGT